MNCTSKECTKEATHKAIVQGHGFVPPQNISVLYCEEHIKNKLCTIKLIGE